MKKLAIILTGLMVFSCQDIENCGTDDNRDFMILRFYDRETTASKKVAFQVSSGNIVYGEGFYSDDSTAIGLPLNPNSLETTFRFDSVGTSVSYELTIGYVTSLEIFDPKCDPSFYYSNLDTLSHTFDSLSIPGTITNRQISTNVEIYF